MFTQLQITQLDAPLSRENVKTRKGGGGKGLSYIAGHHAVREANRIFGFAGWDRETVDIRCTKESLPLIYFARVRVTVRAGDMLVSRDGCGMGIGQGQDIVAAHEKAMKEAETDATKRALMTFGDQFGLALYDPEQEHVSNGEQSERRASNPEQAQSTPQANRANPAAKPAAMPSDTAKQNSQAPLTMGNAQVPKTPSDGSGKREAPNSDPLPPRQKPETYADRETRLASEAFREIIMTGKCERTGVTLPSPYRCVRELRERLDEDGSSRTQGYLNQLRNGYIKRVWGKVQEKDRDAITDAMCELKEGIAEGFKPTTDVPHDPQAGEVLEAAQ